MQENSPVVPSPTPPVSSLPTANAVVENSQPKSNNLVVALLSILLFVSVTITGFFVYQNQKLTNELKTLKVASLNEINYTPEANQPAITEQTDEWENYTNEENGYSIGFPKEHLTRLNCIGEELTAIKYTEGNQPSSEPITCVRDGRYDLETKTYSTIQSEPEQNESYETVTTDIQIGGLPGKLYINTLISTEVGPYVGWYALARVNKGDKTYEIYFSDKDKLDLFYDILSVFEFTN